MDVAKEVATFTAQGKVSIKTSSQGRSGRFSWESFDARSGQSHYVLEVWGPLGQGRTRLAGTDDQLTITQGGKLLAQGASYQIMLEHLGWSVPLTVLDSWIKGIPHPQLPHDELAAEIGERSFTQAQWQVTLSRFEENYPTRISATRGALRVLLVSKVHQT